MPLTEAEAALSAANAIANTASDVWLAAVDAHGPFSAEAAEAWDAYRVAANAANEAANAVVEAVDSLTPPAP